ncbi:MAG: phospholipid carrier-dependent glycosyltransferase [Candidatus Altiarchaeales archaeon]|nr:phospholipid carrier-dependent glycosyltransferase [Candidatus Altiarchaeales archaeon]
MVRCARLVLLVFVLAFAVRVWGLSSVPDGFFCDEAAIGYDAYSILLTGRDSHGVFLPVYVRRFWNPSMEFLYGYLTLPFISLFGLGVSAVRFPAALFGSLTVLTTYGLVARLYDRRVALLSAFMVAFSPWHLVFTRMAYEASLIPFFTTLGLYLLDRSGDDRRFLPASAVVFGLSFYTYPAMKLATPLVLLAYLVICRGRVTLLTRVHLSSLALLLVLASPAYYVFFFGGGDTSFNALSIFNGSDPARAFANNILSHLHPSFLFFEGDGVNLYSIPYYGLFLRALTPFMFYGLLVSLRSRQGVLMLVLFLAGIIPSSFTASHVPNALRMLPSFPWLEVLASAGILHLFNQLKGGVRPAFAAVVCLLFAADILFMLYAYFTSYPVDSAGWMQPGLNDALSYARGQGGYSHVVVTNRIFIYSKYNVLFFGGVDPRVCQSTGSAGRYLLCGRGVGDCYHNDGTVFDVYSSNEVSLSGSTLFIVAGEELSGVPSKAEFNGYRVVEGVS